MHDASASHLKVVIEHGRWVRGDSWSRRTGSKAFFSGCVIKGCFCRHCWPTTCDRRRSAGERLMGKSVPSKGHAESWALFMEWAHAETVGRLRPADASRSGVRDEAAFQLGSLISLNLMACVDISSLRGGRGFDPAELLRLEAIRLTGLERTAMRLCRAWSHVEKCVIAGSFQEFNAFERVAGRGAAAAW